MKDSLDRRSALRHMSYLVGGAVATPTLFSILQSCEKAPPALEWQAGFLSEEQARLLTKLVEIIIPETDTPGAHQAGVPQFIDNMLDQCLQPEAQAMFTKGLNRVETLSQEDYGKPFLKLAEDQQMAVLSETAAQDYAKESISANPRRPSINSFFKQLKQLTLLGYFTSEIGATEALEYLRIPGGYDACTDLAPAQKDWALS